MSFTKIDDPNQTDSFMQTGTKYTAFFFFLLNGILFNDLCQINGRHEGAKRTPFAFSFQDVPQH